MIIRDIDFDLQRDPRELATRNYRESRRCRTEARYRAISHRTVDQPHEFLGCNNFFGQGCSYEHRAWCHCTSIIASMCKGARAH